MKNQRTVNTTADALIRKLIAEGVVTDPDSARGKVLQAATELFRKQGYERTTVRDLASRVGIQSGSIFHHFPSKQAILCAVMEENIRISIARLEDAVEGEEDPCERLLQMVLSELDSINSEARHALIVVVFEWRSVDESGRVALLELREDYENLWVQAVAAVRPDLPRDEVIVLRKLLAGAINWSSTWFRPDGKLGIQQLAERAVKMVTG